MSKFKDTDEVYDLFVPNDGSKPSLSVKTYGDAKKQLASEGIQRYGNYFTDEEVGRTMAERKKLKINKRLPKIMLPAKKLEMFAEWWNEDVRFEKTIPHSFEEGYLFIENEHGMTTDKFKPLIKLAARQFHTSFRNIENQLQEFLDVMKKITLYFKFVKENEMYVESYDADNLILTRINFAVGEDSEPEPRIVLYDTDKVVEDYEDMDGILNHFNLQFVYYLSTCLWYMATTAPNAKYIYEERHPVIEKRHRHTVHVSDTKYISAPVYDMRKIKTVKVERLVTRKKGWTYSHSFQVHGHYRHYKDGKTIFIESYVKGKGKPFKAQTTILDPEVIKEV